jgi:hypothetical protein
LNSLSANLKKITPLSPESEWDLVIHGPDGRDYKNKSIFKEIVPCKNLI